MLSQQTFNRQKKKARSQKETQCHLIKKRKHQSDLLINIAQDQNKLKSNENDCKILILKQTKQRNLYSNFSLKNIKFAKEIWKEYIIDEINQNISFVEYIPQENSYKVKFAYLEAVRKIIDSKISKYGYSEKIIEDPLRYQISSLSLSNFLERNYYSEEIINALLALYQRHASAAGFLVFNTFAYITMHNLVSNPGTNSDWEVEFNDISYCKGIIFPILITSPVNEFIWVIADPNEK